MKTKTIFKALALAMLMPAMLLTTACSSDDEIVNNENIKKKSRVLPLTVNVTREGNKATTRASYDGETKKLSFSSGDKLFVEGEYKGYYFAGTLDYVSEGTFSGDIKIDDWAEYEGTGLALIKGASTVTATLLPSGYDSKEFLKIINPEECDATLDEPDYNKAFALTKAEVVEQFSLEQASGYSDDYGFDLSPQNAFLYFTINGLTPNSKDVKVSLTGTYTIEGEVNTNASGTATFAMALPKKESISDYILEVEGSEDIEFTSSDKLEAGHIYSITKTPPPHCLEINDDFYYAGFYYADGETWAQAITNHTENACWEIKDGKVYNIEAQQAVCTGSSDTGTIVNPDAKITSGEYSLKIFEELEIGESTISFYSGETWTQAINNHSNANDYLIEDGKVKVDDGSGDYDLLTLNNSYVSPTDVINPEEEDNYKWLRSFVLEDDIYVYYFDGETWGLAKTNHSSENSGWKISKGKVIKTSDNKIVLYDDDGNSVNSGDTINEEIGYYFE